MANPTQHAQRVLDASHEQVQPYMAALFSRLANNYGILFLLVLMVNLIGIPLLMRWMPVPASTANVLGFSAMVLILVYGWRFLENRNQATALFVLYIRYSRQRRDTEDTLKLAQEGALEDENRLYVQVDLLEENATSLLNAVQEQGLAQHPR
ncbi:MAG: hypothetical protein ACFE0Q_00900 [Anaerolineae bacterium]